MSPLPVSRAGIAATVVAALVIIAGLFALGTPSHARERKADRLRVGDLSRLSNLVDRYWATKAALPESLDTLVALRLLDRVPTDPQSHEPYTYLVSGERSYRLCATFTQPSDSTDAFGAGGVAFARDSHSWRHGAGESCFDLTPPLRDSK